MTKARLCEKRRKKTLLTTTKQNKQKTRNPKQKRTPSTESREMLHGRWSVVASCYPQTQTEIPITLLSPTPGSYHGGRAGWPGGSDRKRQKQVGGQIRVHYRGTLMAD